MRVVIIGNGVAGFSAALALRSRDPKAEIVMVSGESDYPFSRPALMYIFMGHMRAEDTRPYEDWVWEKNRIERVRAWVTGVDTQVRRVELDQGAPLAYDKLVLALGSTHNKFGWPGQDLERVQGFVTLSDLETLERTLVGLRRAVIVGGGLIGLEMAEMLHSRGVPVTMLVREACYWNNVLPDEEAKLVGRVIRDESIDLRMESELAEIVGDDQGRAVAVVTKAGERIDCQMVGLAAGVHPNLSAIEGSDIPTGRGVEVDFGFRSSVDDVYAIGDCAELVTPAGERNVIEQLWYTGKMHGQVVADVMTGGARTYDRGIWYNSAKFLDLEFHTYGRVSAGGGAPPVHPDEDSVFWSHPSGRHSLRIAHVQGRVVGFNSLGLRLRQEVCQRWIAERMDVGDVLENLDEANFDPELFGRHEPEIRGALKEQLS
jgi:NADPH-dependent 2,4-dienoyl-CoA reductase/sulfur reductase-like enzyme